MLSGCLLAKPPSQAETLGQALPAGTAVRGKWASPANRQPVTNNWVKSFRDPGLDAIVNQAIANNLDLRQAAARVQIAQQTVTVVGSQLLPQVGINVKGANTYIDKERKTYNSGQALGLVAWEIDLWGRLRSEKAAAQAAADASSLEYAYARQSLAATAAKSWYLCIEAQKMVWLAERSVTIYTELLSLVQARDTAGKVSDFDLVQAKATLSEAKGALLQTRSAYLEAVRGLEQLIGRYPAAELKVAGRYARMPGPARAGLPSSLLQRRPDITSAEQRVLMAFRKEEAAKLALLPSFSLSVAGGRLSDNILSLLQLNPWMVHSVIGMTVPIYTGGALLAEVQIANAKQLEEVARYGSVTLTAFREVENGLSNDRILAQRVVLEYDVVRDRTEAVRLGNLKFQAGSIDLLSLLQLQAYQIAAEATLIQLQDAQLSNRISLYLALGGGFDNAPAASPGGPPVATKQ
ncbi:RND transporter [Verrucomicrobia bacterium SCGC AG-212-E04]|nr:RND transporter [Verrucomicrobia bacterium SCGC AG-212-E04]